jgi:hypothetical protein
MKLAIYNQKEYSGDVDFGNILDDLHALGIDDKTSIMFEDTFKCFIDEDDLLEICEDCFRHGDDWLQFDKYGNDLTVTVRKPDTSLALRKEVKELKGKLANARKAVSNSNFAELKEAIA